jgi:hypothetical protein
VRAGRHGSARRAVCPWRRERRMRRIASFGPCPFAHQASGT